MSKEFLVRVGDKDFDLLKRHIAFLREKEGDVIPKTFVSTVIRRLVSEHLEIVKREGSFIEN